MSKSLKRLKEIIQESLDSHLSWIDYFKRHPEKENSFKNSAGDTKHHQYCIDKYEEALKLLDELKCLTS